MASGADRELWKEDLGSVIDAPTVDANWATIKCDAKVQWFTVDGRTCAVSFSVS
jgi:tRNA-dihydrouridine synthase